MPRTPKGGDYGAYLVGQKAIAEYLGVSVTTLQRLTAELYDAGVLRREMMGSPRVRVVAVHKSILDIWIVQKTLKDGGITWVSRSGKQRKRYAKKGYDPEYEKKRNKGGG